MQGLGDLLAEGKDATPTNLPMGNASGLDISKLMAKFTSSPEIMAKWSKPHVRAALMDVFRHGPEALKKYEQDSEVMDAFTECLEMMQDVQPDTTNRPQQASQEVSSCYCLHCPLIICCGSLVRYSNMPGCSVTCYMSQQEWQPSNVAGECMKSSCTSCTGGSASAARHTQVPV